MVDWASVMGYSEEGDIDSEIGESAEQRMHSDLKKVKRQNIKNNIERKRMKRNSRIKERRKK